MVFGEFIVDPMSGEAVAGARVQIRSSEDHSLLGVAITDEAGAYYAPVSTGGVAPRVYRRVQADGRVEVRVYDPTPSYDVTVAGKLTSMSPTAAYRDALYESVGLTSSASTATLVLAVLDCDLRPVSGASVLVAGAEHILYLDSMNGPDPLATSTSASGNVVILSLNPGETAPTVMVGAETYRPWPVFTVPDQILISFRVP